MYKPFHQEFLLDCDYQKIQLEDYSVQFIDLDEQTFEIPISELDLKISSEANWNEFIVQIPRNMLVVIINDRPHSDNPIYKEFSDNTQKAYLYRLRNVGIACKIIRVVN